VRPGLSPEIDDPIDAVFTWVDGSDPAFRAAFRRHSSFRPEGEDPGARLDGFRDNGELRYSLRALAAYAPWIRRIHLLTNGQVPGWLVRSDPRLHVVRHEEVFPDPGVLPTFNSNAIEMNLHRIPGLARRFLYLNDDVFLGRPVRETDFFLPGGGQRVFLEDHPLPADPLRGSARDRALAARAGTPQETLDTIATAINEIAKMPDVQARLTELSAEPRAYTQAQFARFVDGEFDKYRSIVKTAGIKPE